MGKYLETNDSDMLGNEDAIAVRAAVAVATVLERCGNCLEQFHYEDNYPMRWQGNEVIQLPRLEYLILERNSIRPTFLKI